MSSSRFRSFLSGPSNWPENALVLLLYVALTMVMTYPAVLFLRAKVIGGPEDNFHFLWELWYVAHALFDLHKSPFFDPDVFVPFGFSLIRNQDLSPGTVLLFSPITRLFGEVFTYNVLILLSFPLTALGTYLLARELWSNRAAAFLAGLIVGFCPYRFAHATGHLSIVSTEWIPFFFLYLERLISKPNKKDAVLAGVFFGLSSWTTWYYFFMVPIAAVFYVAFRISWQKRWQDLFHLLRLGLIFVFVALVFVLPFLIPYYLATHGGVVDYRGAGESQAFAAAVADYIIPPATHLWWGSSVARLWRNGPNGLWLSEWQLYLGTAALLLAAAGVFHPRRRVVAALIAMAAACLIFSFGPGVYITHPPPLSASTNDVLLSPMPAPGRLLRLLPGFNNLRGWSRLGFLVQLSVGLLAAGGLAQALEWAKRRLHAGRIVSVGIAGAAMALVIIDFLPKPMAMSAVAPRGVDDWLAKQPGDFAVMEYPIPRHGYGGPAIYTTRLTGKRIIMGNAQNPPNLAYWPDLSAFPAPATLDLLYAWGTKYILVDENLYRAGSSFWNIHQTWDTLESAIKQSPMLKQIAVVKGVHVYQLGADNQQGSELLTNGSFEEGNTKAVPGWKAVGKPTIDRTSKYSAGGRAASGVTEKNFLLSEPVSVEAGQCYRLGVREKADSTKMGTLLLQLDWKNESDGDAHAPATLRVTAHSGGQSSQSTMTVRAPAGAKYAVVRARAASGKVWVDDLSLKEIPSDCEPVLFVTPNPVSVAAGQPGRAAVSWDTCCGAEGRVTVTTDNQAEEVLATGESGLAFLDRIKPAAHYELRLYSAQQPIAIKTASLSATERTATIVADPNPAPPAAGLSRTRISWATLAEGDAEVFVSRDGGPQQLLARGPNGSVEVGWIAPGSSYEFRLYSKDSLRRLLAKTTVTQ
ncbi:MAG TPA: glycosyltransferase family 39 protein [Terriglobales bacterium]|nr:glycosyltransferase family 39 protein [Terriglobales bacterium]